MAKRARFQWKRWAALVPVALGVAVLVLMVRTRQKPSRGDDTPPPQVLRTVEAWRGAVLPRVLAYGEARPRDRWQAVAQVGGRVVHIAPRLDAGNFLSTGSLALRIDPSDYELALSRAEANLANVLAQLGQLGVEETNARQSLELEKGSLELARRELERKRELVADGALSRSQLDAERRNVLNQQLRVQELENQLRLLPTRRDLLEAERARLEIERNQARLNLERTEIRAPFPCRVFRRLVDSDQYVAPGTALLEADGVAVAEVAAELPIGALRNLMEAADGAGAVPEDPDAVRAYMDRLGLSAVVRLAAGDFPTTWSARVDRIQGQLDPQTRTLGVVVAVEGPYEDVVPGRRPPLVRGMYCEVELRARPMAGRVVLPRTALRSRSDGGREVFVVGEGARLERRPVRVDFFLGELAVLESGLAGGEAVVVSDLPYAGEGMRVKALRDAALEARLAALAAGKAPLR